jgi:hypothetical protein
MAIENLLKKKLILALLIFNYPFYWLYIVSKKKDRSLQVIPQLGKRQKERARGGDVWSINPTAHLEFGANRVVPIK